MYNATLQLVVDTYYSYDEFKYDSQSSTLFKNESGLQWTKSGKKFKHFLETTFPG